MVLASVEEGLAYVQGQAMACGCPVIASTNTGGEDLFSDGTEGFIVPIRDPESIRCRLEQLASDPDLQRRMAQASMRRTAEIGGWDTYGSQFMEVCQELSPASRPYVSSRTEPAPQTLERRGVAAQLEGGRP